jgi:hypothetical protein
MWVVPGAPLEEGSGWRVWYSQAGVNDFTPAPVRIFRGRVEEQVNQPWRLMDALPGLNQRMGTRTVMLRNPSPGTQYRIWIPEVAVDVPLFWRSFPTALGAGVTFLFASCFWRPDDKEGAYSAASGSCTSCSPPPSSCSWATRFTWTGPPRPGLALRTAESEDLPGTVRGSLRRILGGSGLSRSAAELTELLPLRRPRVLERLSRTAGPPRADLGILSTGARSSRGGSV